jgi:hypothetical protein
VKSSRNFPVPEKKKFGRCQKLSNDFMKSLISQHHLPFLPFAADNSTADAESPLITEKTTHRDNFFLGIVLCWAFAHLNKKARRFVCNVNKNLFPRR